MRARLLRALYYCAAREEQTYWLLALYTVVFFAAYGLARCL